MKKSAKVYFTDFRARPGLNIPQKLKMLKKNSEKRPVKLQPFGLF